MNEFFGYVRSIHVAAGKCAELEVIAAEQVFERADFEPFGMNTHDAPSVAAFFATLEELSCGGNGTQAELVNEPDELDPGQAGQEPLRRWYGARSGPSLDRPAQLRIRPCVAEHRILLNLLLHDRIPHQLASEIQQPLRDLIHRRRAGCA